MRILFIADDQLIPARDGGRVANLNDLLALQAAGFDVTLLVTLLAPLDAEIARAHRDLCAFTLFTRQRGRAVANLLHPASPMVVSRHIPSRSAVGDLLRELARLPRFDLVLAAHEYTLPLGTTIARHLDLPVVLRSHNDEVRYLRGMAEAASSVKERLFYWSEATRLGFALAALLDSTALVALISPEDRAAYTAHGLQTVVAPPTLSDAPRPAAAVPGFDARRPRIVFVGALGMSNTAAGILWFAREVLPRIQAREPAVELEVVGRGPSESLRHELTRLRGVSVAGELTSLDGPLDRARVFVNPVFHGSGVNMKLGPPAAAGVPIVATTLGLRGLDGLAGAVLTADSADQFANRVIDLLTDPQLWARQSRLTLEAVVSTYSKGAVANAWHDLTRHPALAGYSAPVPGGS